jgi:PAS domain S-box-containing protein
MKTFYKLFNSLGTKTVAFRIVFYYLLFGILWIALSDRILIFLFDPATVDTYAFLQTMKGWLFIVLTGSVLFLLIRSNVRKLHQSKALLRQSEERYKTIFETTGNATLIIEPDMTISLVNREFVSLSGYRKEEIEGKMKWTSFVSADDRERMVAYHKQRRMKNRSAPGRYQFSFITRSGETRIIDLTVGLIPETQQSVASLLDVTENKELEAKYLRAQRMESIGTLAGGVAHDLNNILGPILLSVEALKKSYGDEKSERYLSIIERSTNRGAELVKQILAFARGFYGEKITLQSRHVLKEIESITRATFPRVISVDTRLPGDLWPITGDPTQIHQALLNLCVNARDAMPDGGTLSITAENCIVDDAFASGHHDARAGAYILITVTDTGTGIPDNMKEKIFDPFFTTKEAGKGTGLGLATVDYIMKNHRGFLVVESEIGTGSTFKLFFPALLEQGEQKGTGEGNRPEAPHGNNELLLFVDDDAVVREITSDVLHASGYRVLSARNGAECIAMYEKYRDDISLVLSDSNMPLMRGDDMVRELIGINPEVKILILTGSIDKPMQEGRIANIYGYILKPFTTHRLLYRIHTILHGAGQ